MQRERIAGLIERVRTELAIRNFSYKTNKRHINFIVVTMDRFINDL